MIRLADTRIQSTGGGPMAAPTKQQTACPSAQMLGDLVSGRVPESMAQDLFAHIDGCVRCQKIVDGRQQASDDILKPMNQGESDTADQERIDRLIRNAQQLGTPRDSTAEPTAIPVDSFVDGLKRCGLFPEDQVDSLVNDLDASDSGSLAKALVSRQKLTPFQAKVLLKGKWKGLVLGNYVILDRLGQGGMGTVFKARHVRLGRIVCVKVINSASRKSPQAMERFRNEAKTVAALSHPNFVVAHDADEARGVPFLVMEFIEGKDLARHVSEHGPLPPKTALQLVQKAAAALQYAHDSGVIHRDIKPHNLLLSEPSHPDEVNVKILDMGLARFDSMLSDNADGATHAAMTNTGVIMGTVDYMSPEQALRSRDADNRSDIYSLGCTLHFLLTGKPVFDGDTMMARLIAHREQDIPSLEGHIADAFPGLDTVFRRMIAKNPDDRYQSMQTLADDVETLVDGGVIIPAAAAPALKESAGLPVAPVLAERQSVLAATRRRGRKAGAGFWVGAGAVLIALAVAGAVVPAYLNSDSNPDSMEQASSGTPNPAIIAPAIPDNRRAFIVVASNDFNGDEFQHLTRALKERGTKYVVASTREGHAYARGSSDEDQGIPIRACVEHYDPGKHSSIFIVGGDIHTFRKSVFPGYLSGAFERALAHGDSVAATSGSAADLFDVSEYTKHLTFTPTNDFVKTAKHKAKPGYIMTTIESSDQESVRALVAVTMNKAQTARSRQH